MVPDRETRQGLMARMQVAAGRMRLPFRGRIWRGPGGSWQGAGAGSSIDFQDHRAYLPGDDPRHIDWAAYARSGQYTMKLYREEVSPAVEVVLDVSESMFLTPAKAVRTMELFYFSLESARQAGAMVHVWLMRGEETTPWAVELARGGGDWAALSWRPTGPALAWRQGSLRVWISDLLFAGAPGRFLGALSAARGTGLILAPHAREESEPDWGGNMELADCETGRTRVQLVNGPLLERYRAAWQRHFGLWEEECRRHNVLLARVGDGGDLLTALGAEALPRGAVELA